MKHTKKTSLRFLVHVALLLWMLSSVLPFAWTLLNSVKFPRDANARVPVFSGFDITGSNYARLWLNSSSEEFAPVGIGLLVLVVFLVILGLNIKRLPVRPGLVYGFIVFVIISAILVLPQVAQMAEFYNYFLNSVLVTVGTVAVSISIGCLAGYGLARYTGIAGVVILIAALGFRALPRMAFVLPFYYLGQATGLYDTHFLLIIALVAINQPFTIWMLRSFFMEIPREIEEAAMIDGAGRLTAFIRVIIPIMWPGIITTALFTLLLAYNDFLLPRILTQSNWTLPVALAQFTSGEDAGYTTIAAAGSVSITLPIVFVIIFFQKYLIKGLAFGAVKG